MTRITQPCHKKWNDLEGNEQARFCTLCDKYVHNLNELSEIQIQYLIENEGKVCGMLMKNCVNKKPVFNYKKVFFVLSFLAANVFGQQDSILIKGIVKDSNGIPVLDSKIGLKDSPLSTISDKNGEFELNVPRNLKTYILEIKDSDYQLNVLYKEEELLNKIIIPFENPDEVLIGEVIYKPTFKDRVINTITWPYRKIRSTFFDNP